MSSYHPVAASAVASSSATSSSASPFGDVVMAIPIMPMHLTAASAAASSSSSSSSGAQNRSRRTSSSANVGRSANPAGVMKMLAGLDPRSLLPDGTAVYPCPMGCSLGPFDSQRALYKHMQMHQRAFDEEEQRSGKATFTKFKSTPTKKSHQHHHQQQHHDSDGDVGNSSSAKKKRSSKKQPVEEEGSISDEERRQSAIRREQKRLNAAAAAAAALNPSEKKEPEEEEVRCCLCHSADSDETNQIVMCDGPCDLPFHQWCIGLEHIPKGKWFCSTACKMGRRTDRVEHLATHRLRFQRRRRQMSNPHNAREQALLKDFWDSIDPYFNSRYLTIYGKELLARTIVTPDVLSIPDVGRFYKQVWIEEDEALRSQKVIGRGGRTANKSSDNGATILAAASNSVQPSASPVPMASPTPLSTISLDPSSITASPAATAISPDAEYFAAEGCERLHSFLERESETFKPSEAEIASMESIASKPHTAAVTIYAQIASTAPAPEPPVIDPNVPIDLDLRPPFDRFSYYFPDSNKNDDRWTQQESRTKLLPELPTPSDIQEAAAHLFAPPPTTPARFLTGSQKDKETKEKLKEKLAKAAGSAAADETIKNEPTVKREPGIDTPPTADVAPPLKMDEPTPMEISDEEDVSEDTKQKAQLASSTQSSEVGSDHDAPAIIYTRTACVSSIGGKRPRSVEPVAEPEADAVAAPPVAMFGFPARQLTGGKQPRTQAPVLTPDGPTFTRTLCANSTGGKKPRDVNTGGKAPINADTSSTEASTAAAAIAASSTTNPEVFAALFGSPPPAPIRSLSLSGKSPLDRSSQPATSPATSSPSSSSLGAASTPRSGVGVKAPRPSKQGGKAPRQEKSEQKEQKRQSKKEKSKSKPKPKKKGKRGEDSDEDEEEDEDDDDDESASSGDEDDSMTLSEEEDMRDEEEDAFDDAEQSRNGQGRGKVPGGKGTGKGKTAGAGKGPRGSGPVTSDRVFNIHSRRNDDAEAEELSLEPIEEIEAVATLPTPFFDLRALDLNSSKDIGIKLPKPRIYKMLHQSIVTNFPFIGVVNPALLASSCHYSWPPLLYNYHTMQLIEMNMAATNPNTITAPIATAPTDPTNAAPVKEEKEEINPNPSIILDDAKSQQADPLETLASIQGQLASLNASLDIMEVRPQESIFALLPPPPTIVSLQASTPPAGLMKPDEPEASIYANRWTSTSASRRDRADAKIKREADSAAAAASSVEEIELDTSQVLPLAPSSSQLASLSISPLYDDEVSAELWLAQRQYLLQSTHNNHVRAYLDTRAHNSGDWHTNTAVLDVRAQEEKATMELWEEAFLRTLVRQNRESRRVKSEASETGQIRYIKRQHRIEQRNARAIGRLLKSMVTEVEKRDKRRALHERRTQSAAARDAKKARREAHLAQWKNRRDADNYRRCENALEQIIKTIERQVEGKATMSRKPRDPNAPKRPRKKKEQKEGEIDATQLFCICRTPYDNDRFYLGCENCGDWFHGKCLLFSSLVMMADGTQRAVETLKVGDLLLGEDGRIVRVMCNHLADASGQPLITHHAYTVKVEGCTPFDCTSDHLMTVNSSVDPTTMNSISKSGLVEFTVSELAKREGELWRVPKYDAAGQLIQYDHPVSARLSHLPKSHTIIDPTPPIESIVKLPPIAAGYRFARLNVLAIENDRTHTETDHRFVLANGLLTHNCIGVTEEEAANIDEYICQACEKKTEKMTTYVDAKRDRQIRRAKEKSNEADAESSEESSASSATESEEEEEPLPPILISRIKTRRGKYTYKVVEHNSDEEENEEGSEEEANSDAESEEEEEEDEEEEEEDDDSVAPIKLRRHSRWTIRLRRLPDTSSESETKTRMKTNAKRYEYVASSAWTSLSLIGDEHHEAAHESGARYILRRFRHFRNVYPTIITHSHVRKWGVTPSRAPQTKSKHKFSAYAYRYHHFRVAHVDRNATAITINKKEDITLPPTDFNILASSFFHANAAAIASSTSVASSSSARASAASSSSSSSLPPPRPPVSTSVIDGLMIECPTCHREFRDQIGIIRHHNRAHIGIPRPDTQQLAQEAMQKLKGANTNARAANGRVTPTTGKPPLTGGKRKARDASPEQTAPKEEEEAGESAAPELTSPRTSRRTRATPSPPIVDDAMSDVEPVAASSTAPPPGSGSNRPRRHAAGSSSPASARSSTPISFPLNSAKKGSPTAATRSSGRHTPLSLASSETTSNRRQSLKRGGGAAAASASSPSPTDHRGTPTNGSHSTRRASAASRDLDAATPTPSTPTTQVKKKRKRRGPLDEYAPIEAKEDQPDEVPQVEEEKEENEKDEEDEDKEEEAKDDGKSEGEPDAPAPPSKKQRRHTNASSSPPLSSTPAGSPPPTIVASTLALSLPLTAPTPSAASTSITLTPAAAVSSSDPLLSPNSSAIQMFMDSAELVKMRARQPVHKFVPTG